MLQNPAPILHTLTICHHDHDGTQGPEHGPELTSVAPLAAHKRRPESPVRHVTPRHANLTPRHATWQKAGTRVQGRRAPELKTDKRTPEFSTGTRVENWHPSPTRAAAAGQAGGRRVAFALFSRGKGTRGNLGRPEGLPPSSHLAGY